jgi:hypothetical protein
MNEQGIIEVDENIVGYKADLLRALRKELIRQLQDDTLSLEETKPLFDIVVDIEDRAECDRLIMTYENSMCGPDWKYVTIEDDNE